MVFARFYGAAIDINPIQNPYMSFSNNKTITVEPKASTELYISRKKYRTTNKPVRSGLTEDVIDVFSNNGYLIWGGYWNTPIDYQHF